MKTHRFSTKSLLVHASLILSVVLSRASGQDVVINEIMYHPSSQDARDEWIELHNRSNAPVSLFGWRLTNGVEYRFPNVSIAAHQYLVVAAEYTSFTAKYPSVANVVGNWNGRLENCGERIDLCDLAGLIVDSVRYADEGDWAGREEGPLDLGHRGWIWSGAHDGGGRSLELRNPALPNDYGQNWGPGTVAQGTPGAANSILAANIAPLIVEVARTPIIPHANEMTTVAARLIDELPTGFTATVRHRVDGAGTFASTPMLDDGLHGDGLPSDGVYGAFLPGRPDGTIVEYYIEARDAATSRSLPGPALVGGTLRQVTNFLYLVNNATASMNGITTGAQPLYHVIMTAAERAELADIGLGGGDENSDAQMNATFISIDTHGVQARYCCGVRNRGHGTRDEPPNNYHVNFADDQPWNGVTALNINSKYTHSQTAGCAIFQSAGIAAPDAQPVQVRVNGVNLAEPQLRMFGSYSAKESYNSDFAAHHFPRDDKGNIYMCFRVDPGGVPEAELRYEGANPNVYRNRYFKQTNESEDDWSDLIRLTDVLNNAPAATYFEDVSRVIDVDQWARYLALDSLLQNWETGLVRGIGDDYGLYCGVRDPRFRLIPHDLDTLMGQGNSTGNINHSIFTFRQVDGLNRLFNDPQFVQLYYRAFFDLINGPYGPSRLFPLLDATLGSWVPPARIDAMKQFAVNRSNAVLLQIPQAFSIHCDLTTAGAYYRSTQPNAALYGTAHAAFTRSVLVNGQLASWDPITGRWSLGTPTSATSQIILPRGSQWHYLDDGTSQGTAWRNFSWVDSTWPVGRAQFGYNEGDEATTISYGNNPLAKHITYYFGTAFRVTDISRITSLTVHLLRDDGAAVYLNGAPVVCDKLTSGAYDYLTGALPPAVAGADESTFFRHGVDPKDLVAGTNQLAVEIHQIDGQSSDVSFDLELEAHMAAGQALTGVPLMPGINRVIVQAFDGPNGTGRELNRGYIDIWYDGLSVDAPDGLRLHTRDTYLPGSPILVRVEALNEAGAIDRDLWNSVATLTTDRPGVTLTPTQISMYNGLGSALVTVNGTGDFTITASLPGQGGTPLHASRSLASLAGAPITAVSGALAGTSTTWAGVIRVTSDLTVPLGHTLTIQPGTLVLLNGIVSGDTGTDIDVRGTIRSLGTDLAPVSFISYDPATAWGEMHHDGASPSLYQYTHFLRGGNSPRGGHTNSGPVFRPTNSTITFDHVCITDSAGKVMQSTGSNLTFRDCQMARSVMGPEIASSALLMERTWVSDMLGPDDNDGFYIHTQQAGQTCTMRDCVLARFDDDGLDTLGATIDLENCILRDAYDKAISVFGGRTSVRRGLLVNNGTGASAKENNGGHSVLNLDHATITGNGIGIESNDKYGQPLAWNELFVTNSIIWGNPDSVRTDYNPADIHIRYSDVGEPWAGSSFTLNTDPLFAAAVDRNFHLRANSPCVDAGDPAAPLDPDGTRSDMGFYTIPQDLGTSCSGTLTTDTLFLPDKGPYYIHGDLIVPVGVTLRILPGTSLFFYPTTRIRVYGRLLAQGSDYGTIRFTREPSLSSPWGGIQFLNTMEANELRYCVIEWGVTVNGMVHVENSRLLIDHVMFDHTDRDRIWTRDSSLIVRHCYFADIFGPGVPPTTDNLSEHIWGGGIPAGGEFIIENNVFGTTKGHNDAIDIDGGRRPGPIPQILNNRFMGGGDDALDLEGDMHIEGNVFTHFRKDQWNTASGEANAMSAGSVGAEYVFARNIVYDVDHVVLVKDNTFLSFENNTVVSSTLGAIYFNLQFRRPGRGAFVEGSVFWNTANTFSDVLSTTVLTVNQSVVGSAWVSRGFGNITADPRLANPAALDCSLLPGSPCLATGPNGLDMGALVPGGASITGEPPRFTALRNATLTIDGPAIRQYRFRLDGGSFGGATSITVPLQIVGLSNGDHRVDVQGRNFAGVWQAQPAQSRLWTVNGTTTPITVSEVMFNPLNAGLLGGEYEFLELRNPGTTCSVNLGAMVLSNGIAYVFPANAAIRPGEHVLVVGADPAGNFADFRNYYGLDPSVTIYGPWLGQLRDEGERVTLDTAGGARVLSFEYADGRGWPVPTDGAGHSLVPLNVNSQPDPTLDYGGNWRFCTYIGGSPGAADPVVTPTVVLNEFQANTVLRDPAHPFHTTNDWIELHNVTSAPIALADFYLSDERYDLKKWAVFTTATLPAGGRLSFDEITAFHNPITNGFAVSKAGERLYLSYLPGTAADRVLDAVTFKGQERGASEGRWPETAPYWQALPPTREAGNADPPPRLLVSEFMFHPAGNIYANEYIELTNPTSVPIPLWNAEGPWRIDGVLIYFPLNTSIPGGGTALLVNFDPADTGPLNAFKAAYGITSVTAQLFGPFDGNLSNKGERFAIERPLAPYTPGDMAIWVIVDEVIYFSRAPWTTLASGTGLALHRVSADRSGNDPANWVAGPPSPGATQAVPYHTLTIAAPFGQVLPLPDQVAYAHGTTVTLSAVAQPGYHFVDWTGDVPAGHQLDNPLVLIMDSDKTITARFAADRNTGVTRRWIRYR